MSDFLKQIENPALVPIIGTGLVLWADSEEVTAVESWGRKFAIILPMILVGVVEVVDIVASAALGLLVLALDVAIVLTINLVMLSVCPITDPHNNSIKSIYYDKLFLWNITEAFFKRSINVGGIAIELGALFCIQMCPSIKR